MSWLNKYIRVIRFAFLGLLLLAMIGPWGFDRINVPAEYPCSAPNIRLEGDFCGLPLSGFWMFFAVVVELPGTIARLFNGTDINMDLRSLGLQIVFSLSFVLPILSTILINTRENQRRRQAFHMAAWGLSMGVGLFIGLSIQPNLISRLWGIWLFIGLAAGALILETLTLVAGKNTSRGLA